MSFGTLVRKERLARGIPLRDMARIIGVNPAYLSKIERDEFLPPAEDKVKAIAELFEWDPDELLALADRVASDLIEMIKRHPIQIAAFMRAVRPEDLERFTREAKKRVLAASRLPPGGAG